MIMGFFSKLSKKALENAQEIEDELNRLRNKTNAEIISIIGTGGRLKGLPLIYVCRDEIELKKFTARLPEIIPSINNISEDRNLRDILINYDDSILFFKQIMPNVSFFAVYPNKGDILTIKKWIYNKLESLKEILHDY